MQKLLRRFPEAAARLLLSIALLTTGTAAGAHGQHAHTHGLLSINVAIDAGSVTIELTTPLDNLVGFERAPRTDAERRRVADAIARLEAADRLFIPDPAAECRLSKVSLSSEVLGIGGPGGRSGHAGHGSPGHPREHADLDASIVFACGRAELARFIDVKLFEQFKRLRSVEAQVASPQGQVKRRLNAGSPRLSWGGSSR
ncbi:MAG: DUF2796 domain-containing protein [Burkholderiaceae bacterium]